jgi:flagellar assembly protein FliH
MSLSDLFAPRKNADLAAVRPWEAEPLQEAGAGVPIDQQLLPDRPVPESSEPLLESPETLLDAARAQAAALLLQAEEQAEQLRRSAIREGLREGAAQAEAACAVERARLREVADGITAAVARHCEAQAPALAQLAALAAETLLLDQLALEPERVVAVVRHALEHTLAATQVTVYLHPEDLPLVHSKAALGAALEWQPDPSLERGGCRIESDQGEVDATLSGRLARFREAMHLGARE